MPLSGKKLPTVSVQVFEANRSAGLLALRTIAEAYGGLGAVAAQAEISGESLYRTLSPKGNPTLKTRLAV